MEIGGVGSVPAGYSSSLGSNPDIFPKYKIGDISKERQHTLARKKKVFFRIRFRVRSRKAKVVLEASLEL
jgi:hypothetical protein